MSRRRIVVSLSDDKYTLYLKDHDIQASEIHQCIGERHEADILITGGVHPHSHWIGRAGCTLQDGTSFDMGGLRSIVFTLWRSADDDRWIVRFTTVLSVSVILGFRNLGYLNPDHS